MKRKIKYYLIAILWMTVQFAYSQVNKKIKSELKNEMEIMFMNDQKHRGQLMYGELSLIKLDSLQKLSDKDKYAIWFKLNTSDYGLTKVQADSLWALQSKIDSTNFQRLKEITLTYGWPGRWMIGNDNASIFLLHSSEKYKLDMFPILKSEINKKHIKPLEVAQMYDKMLLERKETQLYGTFSHANKTTGQDDPPLIEDIIKTNAARKDIGLKSLKRYRLFQSFNSVSPSHLNLYHTNINLAEHYHLNQEYLKSDSCYKIAFTIDSINPFNQDLLTASINALLQNDIFNLKSYLLTYSIYGGDYKMLRRKFDSNIILSKNAKSLLSFINKKGNRDLRREMKVNLLNYKSNLNKKLISKIKCMYNYDQCVRSWPANQFSTKTQMKLLDKADRRNANKLIEICEEYGWPGFNLLGEFRSNGKYSFEGVDLMVRHFNIQELKVIEPFYLAAIKNNNAYPFVWASCMDYYYIKNPFYSDSTKIEFKQKYGTMASNKVLIPFGEIDDLYKARQEFNLSNIEDYLKIKGWTISLEKTMIINK